MPSGTRAVKVFKASDWCFPEWSDLTGGSGGGLIYGGEAFFLLICCTGHKPLYGFLLYSDLFFLSSCRNYRCARNKFRDLK